MLKGFAQKRDRKRAYWFDRAAGCSIAGKALPHDRASVWLWDLPPHQFGTERPVRIRATFFAKLVRGGLQALSPRRLAGG